MPLSTAIDPEKKLVINIASGSLSDEDLLHARRDLMADLRFDPSFDRIWDFSDATQADLSDGIIAQLVATSPSGERSFRAVVSTAPGTLARVLEFITHSRQLNRQVAVFPTREKAMTWIQSQHASQPE